MHSMPGLPALHSRELVDRTFQSCALSRPPARAPWTCGPFGIACRWM